MKRNKILLAIVGILCYSNIFAAPADTLPTFMSIMLWITILLIAFVIWLAVVYSEKNDFSGSFFLNPLRGFKNYLTRMAPMDKEQEMLLDHDYDGIRELDNKIPPWFNFLFYGTMLFAIVYIINYHVIGSGQVQEEEYANEVSTAAMEKTILVRSGAFITEATVVLKNDPATLNDGKVIFTKNCAACHAADGGGIVGPNLTDDYWINGGGINNVFKVIKNGVPAKGMISWQTQLNPTQMQSVASYVISLYGITPANPKAPQGNKWISADSTAVGI